VNNIFYQDLVQLLFHELPGCGTSLPDTIGSLANLSRFSLSYNQLTSVNSVVFDLPKLSRIDLSHNQLTFLTAEIGKLFGLTKLDLNNNRLKTLPKELSELKKLSILNLGANEFSTLPEVICDLTNLISLSLNNNQLTSLSNKLGGLAKLSKLDLGSNQLNILPEIVCKLINLTKLHLGYNPMSVLPDSVYFLTNLEVLDLSWNHLKSISNSISHLTRLETLLLDGNSLTILPASISYLSNLKTLHLSLNEIRTLPEEICSLINLTTLSISGNQLRTLPNSISHLSKLTYLYLGGNQLERLPNEISQLTNLIMLELAENRLTSLQDEICQLTNLTTLILAANKLNELPGVICKLTNLTSLDLSGTMLKYLPDEICLLNNLTSLYFAVNQCIMLPDKLCDLTNLTFLDLRANHLTFLPEVVCKLANLITINLRDNQLCTLPDSITNLNNLTSLDLANNPIETLPPSVIEKGILAIEAFFRDFRDAGIPLHEARILIVGEPGAGKTTLMKKLLNPAYELPEKGEDSTLGIQVERDWSFPDCNLPEINFQTHIWDFGGQEIQYMTHQFFLRDRSLYLLVCDDREQNADFDYWFKVINLMGKGCPVLVVLNEKNFRSTTNFDLPYYQNLYPELSIDQFKLNLAEDHERLQRVISSVQQKLCCLPHIGQKLPKAWIPIRQQLEEQKARHHISCSDLAAICAEHGLEREDSVMLVSTYLDALGLIIHFQDDAALRDFVIIDPQWIVNAIYDVLHDDTVQAQCGYFSQPWIENLWKHKGYSHNERLRFISLMEEDNFELCFAVKDCEVHQYIVPQLLPKAAPAYQWQPDNDLQFRINYPVFMPKGIMARLIVRLNDLLLHNNENKPMIWKLGMLLEAQGCKAEALHMPDAQLGGESIFIRVNGNQLHRKELLNDIRKQLQHIHGRSFKNLTVNEHIPCCGSTCSQAEKPNFFSFNKLLTSRQNGRTSSYCEQCNEDIPIDMMIGNVIIVKERSKNELHDDEKDLLMKRLLEGGLNINLNQTNQMNQSVAQTTQVEVTVEIQMINEFAGTLGMLKEDLLDEIEDETERRKVEKAMGKAEKAVAALKDTPPEEAKKNTTALSRLKDSVEAMHNTETTLGKAVSAIEGGMKHANKLAQLYNKIAPWAGLPSLPFGKNPGTV